MARRDRRRQPRIPIEVEILLNPDIDGDGQEAVQLQLRTRNLNTRGAFLELPEWDPPPPCWANAEWWKGRIVNIHVTGSPLCPRGEMRCKAEVRWVERRGPKRRVVGVGVLFLTASDEWIEAVQSFLNSLVK